jgi:hypothetical protein
VSRLIILWDLAQILQLGLLLLQGRLAQLELLELLELLDKPGRPALRGKLAPLALRGKLAPLALRGKLAPLALRVKQVRRAPQGKLALLVIRVLLVFFRLGLDLGQTPLSLLQLLTKLFLMINFTRPFLGTLQLALKLTLMDIAYFAQQN